MTSNGWRIQQSTTVDMAEVSGAAPSDRREDLAPRQKRARAQFVRTLIAKVELFAACGNTADGQSAAPLQRHCRTKVPGRPRERDENGLRQHRVVRMPGAARETNHPLIGFLEIRESRPFDAAGQRRKQSRGEAANASRALARRGGEARLFPLERNSFSLVSVSGFSPCGLDATRNIVLHRRLPGQKNGPVSQRGQVGEEVDVRR